MSARALGRALTTPHASPLQHVLDLQTGEVIALLPDCDPEEDVERFQDRTRFVPVPHVAPDGRSPRDLVHAWLARERLAVSLDED